MNMRREEMKLAGNVKDKNKKTFLELYKIRMESSK